MHVGHHCVAAACLICRVRHTLRIGHIGFRMIRIEGVIRVQLMRHLMDVSLEIEQVENLSHASDAPELLTVGPRVACNA